MDKNFEVKIYEPWVIGLNKVTISLGCFMSFAEAQDRLDATIMAGFTASTLCDSGVTEKILYGDLIKQVSEEAERRGQEKENKMDKNFEAIVEELDSEYQLKENTIGWNLKTLWFNPCNLLKSIREKIQQVSEEAERGELFYKKVIAGLEQQLAEAKSESGGILSDKKILKSWIDQCEDLRFQLKEAVEEAVFLTKELKERTRERDTARERIDHVEKANEDLGKQLTEAIEKGRHIALDELMISPCPKCGAGASFDCYGCVAKDAKEQLAIRTRERDEARKKLLALASDNIPEAPIHWNNSEASAWSQGFSSGQERGNRKGFLRGVAESVNIAKKYECREDCGAWIAQAILKLAEEGES